MRQQPGHLATAISVTTLVALVALTVVACSDGDDGATPAAPPTTSQPSEVAELVEDDLAATAVSDAVAALRAGGSGTFTAQLVYDGTTYDYYGSYRLSPGQHRLSLTADLTDGPVVAEVIGDAGDLFVRLPPDGPVSSPCWVTGDPASVAEVTRVETNPDFEQLPGAVLLAATARGAAYVDDPVSNDVLGTVDLATTTALISPRLPPLLGIVDGSDRVLARFSLDEDGDLIGISVAGTAILASLEEAGTEVDPAELAEVFGAEVPVEVGLADSGEDVVIQRPAPDAVIDLGAPDARERLLACD